MIKLISVIFVFLLSIQVVVAKTNKTSSTTLLSEKEMMLEESKPWTLEEKTPTEQTTQVPKSSLASQVGVMVVWLIFIVVLIYALAYAFKKLAPPKAGLINNDAIEVLCKQYIDPKQKIAVVKVHNKVLILGVGTNGITKISEFTDKADVDYFTSMFALDKNNLFGRMLNKQTQKIVEENQDSFDKKLTEVRDSLKKT